MAEGKTLFSWTSDITLMEGPPTATKALLHKTMLDSDARQHGCESQGVDDRQKVARTDCARTHFILRSSSPMPRAMISFMISDVPA